MAAKWQQVALGHAGLSGANAADDVHDQGESGHQAMSGSGSASNAAASGSYGGVPQRFHELMIVPSNSDVLFTLHTQPAMKKRRGRPRNIDRMVRANLVGTDQGEASHEVSPLEQQGAATQAIPTKTQTINQIQATRVPKPSAASCVSSNNTGYSAVPSLLPTLNSLHSYIAQQGFDTDLDIEKMSGFYLDPDKYHVTSSAMKRKFLELSTYSTTSKTFRLASSLTLAYKLEFVKLMEMISKYIPTKCFHYVVDNSSYDETSMICNVQDQAMEIVLDAMERGRPAPGAQHDVQRLANMVNKGKKHQGVVVAKLLQTKSSFGMVLEMADKNYVILSGYHLNNLQVMGRANAEVLLGCLLQGAEVPRAFGKFQLACRSTCTDKAGYNQLGESMLLSARGDPWCSIHLHCDAHVLATCLKHTMNYMSSDMMLRHHWCSQSWDVSQGWNILLTLQEGCGCCCQ
eukprot:6487089-Amphidinium_carterae.1